MPIDWDRRHCARRGHQTYAPTEQQLAGRLRATTAAGEAWRCLRCGDFVVGRPRGFGPADEAPLVPRGRALRDLLVLRVLAVERFVRGLFIALAAVAVWRFSDAEDSVRRIFQEDLTLLRPIAKHFNYDLDHSPVVYSIQKTFDYKHSTLLMAAGVLALYALVQIAEGVGLWLARRWGEYLSVVATSATIPLEVYELTEKTNWLKIALLAVNILAVLYILLSKRLFGLRGGHPAFERERRSASLIEVERAALVDPAAPPLPEAAT